MRLLLVPTSGLLLWAAGLGCNSTLPPSQRVDKLRLLAVRAEPPEIAPGKSSRLDALIGLPDRTGQPATVLSYLWLACQEPVGTQMPAPCGVSADGNGGPDAFASGDGGSFASIPGCSDQPDARLCSLGNGTTAVYTPKVSVASGSSTQVLVTLIVAEGSGQAGDFDALACARYAAQGTGAPPDPDHCVISLKRLTISNKGPSHVRNNNPHLRQLGLGFNSLLTGTAPFHQTGSGESPTDYPLAASRCTHGLVNVDPSCPAGSDSEVEDDNNNIHEPLYVTWFTTAGNLADPRTAFQPASCTGDCLKKDLPEDPVSTTWTAPDAAEYKQRVASGVVHFWAVIRDDRDGVGWLLGTANGTTSN